MRFSVIIPIYKVENYLRQCVDSVLSQSFESFEVILVDDGSPDGCPAICDEYAAKGSRVVVLHQENGGHSAARNAGLKVARGDYVVFLDSDDYWDGVNCLKSINDATKVNPDIVLFRSKKLFDKTKKVKYDGKTFCSIEADWNEPGELFPKLVMHGLFGACPWIMSVRRELLMDNKIEFEKGRFTEDVLWSMDVIMHARKYAFVDDDFHVYRQRSGSITATPMRLKNLTDFLYIIRTFVSRVERSEAPNDLKIATFQYMANEYSNLLIVYALVSDRIKKQYRHEIRSYAWLLNHAISKRPRLVRQSLKVVGFDATILMLHPLCFAKGYRRYKD